MNPARSFQDVVGAYAKVLETLAGLEQPDLEPFVEAVIGENARLVVAGIGKSGVVARKIAATLSSTGTPGVFLHAADACHGDVGCLRPPDMLLAVSNSGETEEILRLIPYLRRFGVPLAAITGAPQSTLAHNARFVLHTGAPAEVCPLGLAPTATSAAALAIGDALAVTLMRSRDFGLGDFALRHPAGALGVLSSISVGEVMRRPAPPMVRPDVFLPELSVAMSRGGFGLAVVVDEAERVLGVVTDGDVRRLLARTASVACPATGAGGVMTRKPKCVRPDAPLIEAKRIMLDNKITSLLVVEDGRVLGVVQIYDVEAAAQGGGAARLR